MAVLSFKIPDLRSRYMGGHFGKSHEITMQAFLLVLVPLRPAGERSVRHVPEEGIAGWTTFSDLCRDVRVAFGRLAIALPNSLPWPFVVGEPDSPSQDAVVSRVEGQLGCADLDKGLPLVFTATCLERLSLIEPLQQVANGIPAREQGIEVVPVKSLAFQQRDILVEEPRQRELHGVLGFVVLGHIQAKPALIRFQEGKNRPVLRIDLRPDRAPVLQFGKWLQVIRATFDGPQILAADARQIKNRRPVRGQGNIRSLTGEHTAQPDGRSRALVRRKIAQDHEFRQFGLKNG